MKKCSKKGFCGAVEKLVEFDVRKKTISINQYMNIKTDKLIHRMVFRYADGIVALNFCPWCGSKVIDGVVRN